MTRRAAPSGTAAAAGAPAPGGEAVAALARAHRLRLVPLDLGAQAFRRRHPAVAVTLGAQRCRPWISSLEPLSISRSRGGSGSWLGAATR